MRLGVFATDKIEDDRRTAAKFLAPRVADIHNFEQAADADRLTLDRLTRRRFLRLLHQLCHTLGLFPLVGTAERLPILLHRPLNHVAVDEKVLAPNATSATILCSPIHAAADTLCPG